MTDLKTIAETLVTHCRTETTREGLDTLYAEDAVSVEAMTGPGMENRETAGRAAIHAKHDWWEGAMEVHSHSADGPYLHGDDQFAVIFEMDVTERANGQRMQMKEVGVYTVAGGNIVREAFYYTM